MSDVLVIGAGGYVGGAVARALQRSGFHTAIGAGRRASPGLAARGVTWRFCEATDPNSVAVAAKGVSCIVNAVLGGGATMLAATRNVCAAAGTGGKVRVIHLSTMAVYGGATGTIDEANDLHGADGYGAAKLACERIMADFIAAGGAAVILRPGIVHGPGGQQWTGRFGRMLRRRRLGDLGPLADGRCNLTYIDDLAAAVVAAVQSDAALGEAFNVSDPCPPTWNQYLIALGALVGGVPVRRASATRLRIETRLIAPPLQVLKLLGARIRLAAGALPEPVPPSLLRLFGQDIRLDHRKADRMLGFTRTPPLAALDAAADWFRATHPA